MIGLSAIGIIFYMIFTLIRNALSARQLSGSDEFSGSIELILPLSARSEVSPESWLDTLKDFRKVPGQIKIHILIDGHHPAITQWQQLQERLPYVQIHHFLLRPAGTHPVPWMMEQIAAKLGADVVIIGDPELIPTEAAFLSVAKQVTDKDLPLLVLPQTARSNLLGEAVAVLNPGLALMSVIGFKRRGNLVAHPLAFLALSWLALPRATFAGLDFKRMPFDSWKLGVFRHLELDKKRVGLALGEKQIMRHYPLQPQQQIQALDKFWQGAFYDLKDRLPLLFFLAALIIWSIPMIFWFSSPIWAMATFLLLVAYRFFTKIVFQESWSAFFLHPIGCLILMLSLVKLGIAALLRAKAARKITG
jgi:hypothetical protein